MKPDVVEIWGIVRTPDGKLFEGALVEATLKPLNLISGPNIIKQVPIRTFSDDFGLWSLALVPNDVDTYYEFKIVQHVTSVYKKVVKKPDGNIEKIEFTELPDVTKPQHKFIGR